MSAGARSVAGRRGRRARALTRYRPSVKLVAAVVGVVVVLGTAFLWFRDSSLVAVKRVQVIGASGPDAAHVRSALVAAAHNMTTMDVNMGQLHTAVTPYPDVKSLQVSTQFPHGMRIRVIEQIPVAVVIDDGKRIAVAGDGTLLHRTASNLPLPVIPLRVPPGGPRLTGYALAEVQLLAAAPYQLLSHVASVTDNATHGLSVQLRNGPDIYFGDSNALVAKWRSAAAVLAGAGSVGASYIDVTDPNRPVAGAGSDGGATGSASSASAASGAATSSGGASAAGSTGASTATSATSTAQSAATSPAAGGTAPTGTVTSQSATTGPSGT